MLPRVLEPEVMDTVEEARDYNAMDHDLVNRVFCRDFLAVWNGLNPILDVGTGTALIPLELCRQSPDTLVTGVDLAEQMLIVGRDNVRRAGLDKRIELRRCDAKALSFEAGSFGAVISNSIVHHIPEPGAVFREMIRVTRPGGTLFVRDLLRPIDRDTLRRLVETYTCGANEHQQQMFADSLQAALTLAEVRDHISSMGFSPESVQQTTDRHWTWSATKP
jgi:ubiquinone/menaquinone biosynthesis C-methylase UbiE